MSTVTEFQADIVSYHDDPAVGSTMAEVFRQSPARYHALYVARTMPKPKPSDAQAIGTFLHLCVLEPDLWQKCVVTAPECDRRTKEGKAIWQAFADQAADKFVLDRDEHAMIQAMREGILTNPAARELIESPGKREHGVKWEHHGLTLKCRFDLLTDSGIHVSLKTSRDPYPATFGRHAANLGYHRQQAHYALPGLAERTLHVVVGNTAPHECFVYEFDEPFRTLGEVQHATTLQRLLDAYSFDHWTTPGYGEIVALSAPAWNFSQGESCD